jgi:hypothetical protein
LPHDAVLLNILFILNGINDELLFKYFFSPSSLSQCQRRDSNPRSWNSGLNALPLCYHFFAIIGAKLCLLMPLLVKIMPNMIGTIGSGYALKQKKNQIFFSLY